MHVVLLGTLILWSLGVTAEDPCALIGGSRWVSPAEARACIGSFPVEPTIKSNTIEVLNKTLPFHTSTAYQVQAPPPFNDIHEDLYKDLARINSQDYESEFEFHLDLFRSFKRVNDGHCVVLNYCYDSLYMSYIPTPIVLLTEPDGSQNVYIAPEAFKVAQAEFSDAIEFWQNSLPGMLRGQLESLSGARVLLINGEDPFVAVDKNAEVTGSYQAFGTRQNSFFASYYRGDKGWQYSLGNFAQQIHPLFDNVTLTIRRTNSRTIDVITLPYRSRLGSAARNFTDSATYRERNCVPKSGTNGFDMYHPPSSSFLSPDGLTVTAFAQHPPLSLYESRKHKINAIMDGAPLSDIDLPEVLQPGLEGLNESYNVAQFYMLESSPKQKNEKTGVLALGSFATANFTAFQLSLSNGLKELKNRGATQLVVDVTNNGGGYICIAHWLHRIIIGPTRRTEPQAGLDTALRANPLAQLIVESIVDPIANTTDPDDLLLYNPTHWTNASHITFDRSENWLAEKGAGKVDWRKVNGRTVAFSQRLGQECQPFAIEPPEEGLFDAKKVAIVSNGRCASSCSLFSITMSKLHGVKTIVTGGSSDIPQQYCGTVGGQSTDFSTIDTEIKTAGLKNHTLSPPDLLSNIVQGITWRLGFGLGSHREEAEEWLDHPADWNMPLTMKTVNNPVAIWNEVVEAMFPEDNHAVQMGEGRLGTPVLVVQE